MTDTTRRRLVAALPGVAIGASVRTAPLQTEVPGGTAGNDFKPEGAGAVARPTSAAIQDLGQNLKNFGAAVGTGSSSADTAAWQAALNSLASTGGRKLIVPPGEYLIDQTIEPPANLNCVEIAGQGGYDGVRGRPNKGQYTSLKWVGSDDPKAAVVRFDRPSGCVWRGISIDCNYRAGFGLQILSTVRDTGAVKNVVEKCSIYYARRDGIIVGEWGDPAAPPGGRQFFGNRFEDLTFYGCGQSGIHINEWNADQQIFDSVMVYPDDGARPQRALNAFWFESGGQYSLLQNCQSGGLSVVPGIRSSGYMIRNEKSDSSTGGAFGLDVVNCWQEGEGGLYYGVTSSNDRKAFRFEHCASFTSNPANRSVYIDKGTSEQIPYTFDTCTFLSDIEIASETFQKQSLSLTNCSFASGRGLIDGTGNRIVDGTFEQKGPAANQLVIPAFADVMRATLGDAIKAVFANGVHKRGDKLTLLLRQDATGGHIVDFSQSGNFSNRPAIPQPNPRGGAQTVYSFVSDGSSYYLIGVQGLRGEHISDPFGGGTVDREARSAINALLAFHRARGDID